MSANLGTRPPLRASATPWNVVLVGLTPPGASPASFDSVDIQDTGFKSIRLQPDARYAAAQFFKTFRSFLELGADDEMRERFASPERETGDFLEIIRRYQQFHKGLPVLGAGYALSTTPEGQVLGGSGKPAAGIQVDVGDIRLTDDQAFEIAKETVGHADDTALERLNPRDDRAVSSKGYAMTPGTWAVVYRFVFDVPETSSSWTVEVNAKTGEVWNGRSNRFPIEVPEPHEAIQAKVLTHFQSKAFQIPVDRAADETCRLMSLMDTPLPKIIRPATSVFTFDGRTEAANPFLFSDENCFFGETAQEENDRIGGDVHWGLLSMMDDMAKTFFWAGLDGYGKVPILQIVMDIPQEDWVGYFDAEKNLIAYDEEHMKGLIQDSALLGLSTIGHEYTHGVIAHVAKLEYSEYTDETAAVNEAFADSFGTFLFDHRVRVHTPDVSCEYTLSLLSPEDDEPRVYKGLHYWDAAVPCSGGDPACHAHHNAVFFNWMFYLLANGGSGTDDQILPPNYSVEGIGCPKAGAIAFQTILRHLPERATFQDACRGFIQSAEDLFDRDSPEVIAATNACHAVGLGFPYGYEASKRTYVPTQGSVDQPPWPATLKWSPLAGEARWQVQVSETSVMPESFTRADNPLLLDEKRHKEVDQPLASFTLEPNKTYFWRVRGFSPPPATAGTDRDYRATGTSIAMSAAGALAQKWEPWGPIQFFTTGNAKPTLLSPSSSVLQPPWPTQISWKSVPGASGYEVHLSENPRYTPCIPGYRTGTGTSSAGPSSAPAPTGGGTSKTFELAGNVSSLPVDLQPGATYHLWLRALREEGGKSACAGGETGVRFTTKDHKVVLKSPANAAKLPAGEVPFEWEHGHPGTRNFNIQIAKDASFQEIVHSAPKLATVTEKLSLEEKTGWYYWRVRANGPRHFDSSGEITSGVWSETRAFRAETRLSQPVALYPLSQDRVPYGGRGELKFYWVPVPGAKEYEVAYFRKEADGTLTPAGSAGSAIPWTFKGNVLDPNGFSPRTYTGPAMHATRPPSAERHGFCWKVRVKSPAESRWSETQCPGVTPGPPHPLCVGNPNWSTCAEGFVRFGIVHGASMTLSWDSQIPSDGGYAVAVYPGSFQGFMKPGRRWQDEIGPNAMCVQKTASKSVLCKPIQNYGFDQTYSWQVCSVAPNDVVWACNEKSFQVDVASKEEIEEGQRDKDAEDAAEEEKPKTEPSACQALSPPGAVAPASTNVVGKRPNFLWTQVPGATHYQLDVLKFMGSASTGVYQTFWTYVYNAGALTGPTPGFLQAVLPKDLDPGSFYGWCVRAKKGNSCSLSPIEFGTNCTSPFYVQ